MLFLVCRVAVFKLNIVKITILIHEKVTQTRRGKSVFYSLEMIFINRYIHTTRLFGHSFAKIGIFLQTAKQKDDISVKCFADCSFCSSILRRDVRIL